MPDDIPDNPLRWPDEAGDREATPPPAEAAAGRGGGSADAVDEIVPDPEVSGQARAAALREAAATVAAEPEGIREAADGGGSATAAVAPATAELREVGATPVPGAAGAVVASPWPVEEKPSGAADPSATTSGGVDDLPAPPSHADWRQLADEVRRLAAQIAHGRG